MSTVSRPGGVEAFLREVPLFSGLSDPDLGQLAALMQERSFAAGEELFGEGQEGHEAYVIAAGEIEILKSSAGRQVLLAVRGRGELIGELALLEDALRMASARAATQATVLVVGKNELNGLLASSPTASRAMLHTVVSRLQTTEAMLRESERMAQIGVLSAGMAHELNNPAAAVLRGAAHLGDAMAALRGAWDRLVNAGLGPSQTAELERVLAGATAAAAAGPAGLNAADREEALERWLGRRGISGPRVEAAELVDAGIGTGELDRLEASFPTGSLSAVLECVAAYHLVSSLLREISGGAGQIASIVGALKTYAYPDRAPAEQVPHAADLHEGLENALILLRSKLKGRIEVRRDLAPALPRIPAYGSELDQVWTNLIDNAADAMPDGGVLHLRTRADGKWVEVEIEDDGPGISDSIRPRLFSPFFTTKPVGAGNGLGLSISQNIVHRHGGQIRVRSRPGRTVFQVRLPRDPAAMPGGVPPLEGGGREPSSGG